MHRSSQGNTPTAEGLSSAAHCTLKISSVHSIQFGQLYTDRELCKTSDYGFQKYLMMYRVLSVHNLGWLENV